jgi:hypothetical protein
MIIWPATTHRSNWTTFPTPGWQYACSESGYTDSKISLEWLKRIFDPQTKERANQKPRVLICDGFGTHETLEMLEHCFENNIILCRLPSHTSHKLQPCDVAVFAPLKAAYRGQVDRLERAGTNTIGKEHFTSLYSPARERAFTKKNILAGWAKCGLQPFDPERVLKDTPKPPAELTILEANEVAVRSCPQDDVLRTPMTPVSAETLMSLQNFIAQKCAHALDETGNQNLVRYLQKFTNAAQTSFAKGVIQQNQIRFLIKMNDESKARRSTTSVVLGKAKIMSYEDLGEARAKRAEKEAAKEAKGKGKRGRKPKSAAPEAEEASADKVKRGRKRKRTTPEADASEPKVKMARMSEGLVEEDEIASGPFRAPVARMSEAQVMVDESNTRDRSSVSVWINFLRQARAGFVTSYYTVIRFDSTFGAMEREWTSVVEQSFCDEASCPPRSVLSGIADGVAFVLPSLLANYTIY